LETGKDPILLFENRMHLQSNKRMP
jgi:hypothetical protein